MVWDPPKKEVNVTRMIIYSFIPILAVYAGWRIQKFWVIGAIQLLVGYGLIFPIELFFEVMGIPGYLISIPISIVMTIYIVKHYAKKYNEKIKSV